MPTWKLTLEYDGRTFSGWQRQKNAVAIQEVVEDALGAMFGGERIVVHMAGRTDAGVHALGQVISFRAATSRDPVKVRLGVNSFLPEQIKCVGAEVVGDDFHARFSARGKTYRYVVLPRSDPSPFWVGRALLVRNEVDWEALDGALAALVGTHDFTSFRGPGCEGRDPVRTIDSAVRTEVEGLHRIEFRGRGFVRYQVRIMVGTLLEIGLGRRPADDIPRILAAKDRAAAGRTALPDGLYLVEVRY